jgi:hypothetical protein
MPRETLFIGEYENYDPGDYIEGALKKLDSMLAEIYAAMETADTQYIYKTIDGVRWRTGARKVDGGDQWVIDKALTALGFDGVESENEGATGDWIKVWWQQFPG